MNSNSGGGPPSDRTIIKPRPGAGRVATPAGSVPTPPPQVAAGIPDAGPPMASAAPARIEFIRAGLDPLFHAAGPLLLLAGRLRHTTQPMDTAGLRRQLVAEVRGFEEKGRSAGVPADQLAAARYALCATLDEAVLSTPWGANSDWGSQPLLVIFHRETWGGEKFFQLLDRTKADPNQYAGLLDVLFACLSLGFTGRYALDPQGPMKRDQMLHDLFERIRGTRGTASASLADHWQGVREKKRPLLHLLPVWVVAAAGLAVASAAFLYYRLQLSRQAEPALAALSQVGTGEFTAATPPPVAPLATDKTLKILLSDLEQQGVLSVEEDGARATVTIAGSDLFASGSATINEQYGVVLQRIAEALNEVPGPVLVVGHTDDQPIRSFKYQNNYELSADRAEAVVNELKVTLRESARLRSTGVGSSQPRYQPPDTRENRARNRRVEIVHIAEAPAVQ